AGNTARSMLPRVALGPANRSARATMRKAANQKAPQGWLEPESAPDERETGKGRQRSRHRLKKQELRTAPDGPARIPQLAKGQRLAQIPGRGPPPAARGDETTSRDSWSIRQPLRSSCDTCGRAP